MSLKMLRNVRPTEKSSNWPARKSWWTDQSRRAIAQLDDDRVSDLSELGRRIRRDIRRRHIGWQYKEKAMTTLSVSYDRRWPHWQLPKLRNAIAATIDAFREALDMRRAAHKKHPFIDE
jgi:hypothetical protein